jgi:threonine aldolase
MKTIDLRSDTVTRPTEAMRAAMAVAEVGDDVYGDDPTVYRLERMIADSLGFEAAVFASSGTQANLIAIMSHCGRGDEYIVGQQAHTYKYEAGGAAVLGSVQPQPIEFEDDSTLDLFKIEAKIKPDDVHFARTRLLCLENTHNGKALPMAYLTEAQTFARKKGLKLHLDGARLYNAAIKHQIDAREIAGHFDSVSVCLSKGLGAPVGSVLCGKSALIKEARKWRKMVGGGMRQAGILAAAGIYALENNIARLADDHANAKRLAEGLNVFPELSVDYDPTRTNMVFFSAEEIMIQRLAEFMAEQNILISPRQPVRLVTHLDIDAGDVSKFLQFCSDFFNLLNKQG